MLTNPLYRIARSIPTKGISPIIPRITIRPLSTNVASAPIVSRTFQERKEELELKRIAELNKIEADEKEAMVGFKVVGCLLVMTGFTVYGSNFIGKSY